MKKVILIIILLITLTNNKFLIKADEDISNDTVTEDEVESQGVIEDWVNEYEMEYTDLSYFDSKGEMVDDDHKIIVYYDSDPIKDTQIFAKSILEETIKLKDLFCSAEGYNLKVPSSGTSGYFRVYIEYETHMDGNSGSAYPGKKFITINDYGYYSYIVINYNLFKSSSLGTRENDAYLSTLAHEYFHAIMYKYGLVSINLPMNDEFNQVNWFHEGVASAIGLNYFISQYGDSIVNTDVEETFRHRMGSYLLNTNISLYEYLTFDTSTLFADNKRGYHSFGFFYLLIDRYGMDTLKEILEKYMDGLSIVSAVNQELIDRNTSFVELYLEFAGMNAFAKYSYEEFLGAYSKEFINPFTEIPLDDNHLYTYSDVLPELSSQYYQLPNNTSTKSYTIAFNFENYEYMDVQIIYLDLADNVLCNEVNLTSNNTKLVIDKNDIYMYKKIIVCVSNKSLENQEKSYSIEIQENIIRNISISNNDISNYFDSNYDYLYCKIQPQITDMYKVKLEISDSEYDYNEGIIEILDENLNLIFKSSHSDYQDYAENDDSRNSLMCFLEAGKEYYIRINYVNVDSTVELSINNVQNSEDKIALFENYNHLSEEVKLGDNVKIFNAYHVGKFNLNFNFNNVANSNIDLLILRKHADNFSVILFEKISTSKEISTDITLHEGTNIYICLFGISTENIIYDISITRLIETNISLWTDPNENVTFGSEVAMNGGGYQGTTITQGYTRCIYINETQNSKSRLDYFWYSSNEDAAKVSEFGTVTAISNIQTTVTIYAVYKGNPGKVGKITLLIKPDTLSEIVNVILTTDVREGGITSGTEVTENGGIVEDNSMHVGYTRLICFDSNSPTTAIQDFIWTSSNEDVAVVSEFGTITAVGEGEVIISGVYKYNPNFIAEIYIAVN